MISKEAMKSLDKFSRIVDIIENKIELSKEEILMELYIELKCDYENIKKIFRNYYNGDCGIDGYIIKRKICRTLEDIYNIQDKNLQNNKIKLLTGRTREQFNRMIKQRYNYTLKDFLERKELFFILEDPIDIKAIHYTFERIEKSLVRLDKLGFFNANSKRTRVELTNVNIQAMSEVLFMQKEYIYYGKIPKSEKSKQDYLLSMLVNDQILKNWETIKNNLKKGSYKQLVTLEDIIKLDDKIEDELIENTCYFCEKEILNNALIINGIAYYVFDRSPLKQSLQYFTLPNRLELYTTILSKTKSFMEEVCLYNLNFILNDNSNEIIKEINQKLLINSSYDIKYNYYLAIEEISKNFNKIEKEIFYLILSIENGWNKEMSIEEGYKLLKEKFLDLTIKKYQDCFKELLLKGFISLKPL